MIFYYVLSFNFKKKKKMLVYENTLFHFHIKSKIGIKIY